MRVRATATSPLFGAEYGYCGKYLHLRLYSNKPYPLACIK